MNSETPAAVPASVPAPSSDPTAATYKSNPFHPAISVLGSTLKMNGIALLQISALITAVILAAYFATLAGLILPGLSPEYGFFFILPILAVVAFAYWGSRLLAALIRLWGASSDGTEMTWREAYADTNKYVLKLVGLILLMALILIPAYFLFVIPGLYLTGRLGLAVSALVSENLSVIAALKRSWALSKGHVVEILGAQYASTLLGTNGLVGLNYVPSSSYGRYRQLAALPEDATEKPKVHWLNWLFVVVIPILTTLFLTFYLATIVNSINNMQNQAPTTTSEDL